MKRFLLPLAVLTIGLMTADIAAAQSGACCRYENDGGTAVLVSPQGCLVLTAIQCARQPFVADTVDATIFYIGESCPPEPLGACPNNFALPVELTSFDAVTDKQDIVLKWETASETNNAGFNVEREVGSDVYEELGFVEGYGTTSEPRTYEFRVSDLDPGRHTFRLKQVDYDGAFEYSPLAEATVELPGTYVLEPAYPNPFNPATTIRFGTAVESHVKVELFDATGKLVQTLFEGVPETGTMHSLTIDGAGLSSGTYLVKLTSEDFQTSQPIVLLK